MSNIASPHKIALLILPALLLAGCVYTDADTVRTTGEPVAAAHHNNSEIIITEAQPTDRAYKVVGTVKAVALSVNLLSSDPTRADIDEALRAEAAKQGADAVINVRYLTKPQGLASRGRMTASGTAIVFTDR